MILLSGRSRSQRSIRRITGDAHGTSRQQPLWPSGPIGLVANKWQRWPESLPGFRPPRRLPAWSHVQDQPTSRPAPCRATTLLVSVEPCSGPAVVPRRDAFGHHAACQCGAMFRTSRRRATRRPRPPRCSPAWSHVQDQPSSRHAPCRATTLLVSVEPCSGPAVVPPRAVLGHHAACQRGAMFRTSRRRATRPVGPPRCLPAWSHVQDQPTSRHAPCRATTLLASVEPCSGPADVPPRALSGHHAARQRGAMFRTSRRPAPGSSVLNTAPRWRAAWWRSGGYPSKVASATTLLVSVEPCSGPADVAPRALSGHHAACQRGAMFRTSRRPAPRRPRPPRCLPAWSHVQDQPSSRAATPSATTLLVSVEPCSGPADVPPRALSGHHAACQRGAMFRTSRRRDPGSSVLNTAPRWRAAWWRSERSRGHLWL